jgi:RNA polymerase sigma-70 factor, ECF subfamily
VVETSAFETLVATHRRALLGSYHDAEEATQETLLRAWRARETYAGHAPLRHWLFRIATNACLNLRRDRQPAAFAEVAFLQPYPDDLLDRLPAADGPPELVEIRGRAAVTGFFATVPEGGRLDRFPDPALFPVFDLPASIPVPVSVPRRSLI